MPVRLVPLLLFVLGACALAFLVTPEEERLSGGAQVTDGDSLRLAGRPIRLAGIDAPELAQTCGRGGRERPCGREARRALVELIGDDEVECTLEGNDRYGRRLGRCRAGRRDLNEAMVLGGQAVAYGAYRAQERDARIARRGLWAGDFERPADWRKRRRGRSEAS